MAEVLLIKEDLFNGARARATSTSDTQTPSKSFIQKAVRRPLVGTSIKADKYAVIRVYKASGLNGTDVYNSSAPTLKVNYTSNLMIQSVNETRQEKSQIIQTFGEDFVYFFGEQPTQVQISAQLLDTLNFQWHQEWWMNYSEALRGTKLVDKNSRVYLEVDDVMFEGFITTASTTRIADDQNRVTLNFTLLVTDKIYLAELRNSFLPPERLTEEQLNAIKSGDYSNTSSASLSEVDELSSAVDTVVGQAAKGPSVLTTTTPVTVQKSAATSKGSIQEKATRLQKAYALLQERSTKPYFETMASLEYPNGGGNNPSFSVDDIVNSIQNVAVSSYAHATKWLSPEGLKEALQSIPLTKKTSNLNEDNINPSDIQDGGNLLNALTGIDLVRPRGVFSFDPRILSPASPLVTNVGEDVIVPFRLNEEGFSPVPVEKSGPLKSASDNEGTIVEVEQGSYLDRVLNPLVFDVEQLIQDFSTEPIPSTPSGGMTGYDTYLNPTPINTENPTGESTAVVTASSVLVGAAPVLSVGESISTVYYTTVLE